MEVSSTRAERKANNLAAFGVLAIAAVEASLDLTTHRPGNVRRLHDTLGNVALHSLEKLYEMYGDLLEAAGLQQPTRHTDIVDCTELELPVAV